MSKRVGEQKGWEVRVDLPPMPKKRPRVTKNGTFMPKEYREWREQVGWLLKAGGAGGLSGAVGLVIEFHKDHMVIMASEVQFKRFGQADIDNLIGSVMEVMEDVGVIQNDRQIAAVQARFVHE